MPKNNYFLIMRAYLLILPLLVFLVPFSVSADVVYDVGSESGGECCQVNGVTGDDEMWGQPFTTAEDFALTEAELWASSQGGVDALVIKIYEASAGLPVGSAVYTSSATSANESGALNFEYVTFTDACIPAGDYFWTIERTGSRSSVLNWVVGTIVSGAGMVSSQSGTWTEFSSGDNSLRGAIFGDPATCDDIEPPTESTGDTATSTIDQIHTNTFHGYLLMVMTMFFMVYLFKKR